MEPHDHGPGCLHCAAGRMAKLAICVAGRSPARVVAELLTVVAEILAAMPEPRRSEWLAHSEAALREAVRTIGTPGPSAGDAAPPRYGRVN